MKAKTEIRGVPNLEDAGKEFKDLPGRRTKNLLGEGKAKGERTPHRCPQSVVRLKKNGPSVPLFTKAEN